MWSEGSADKGSNVLSTLVNLVKFTRRAKKLEGLKKDFVVIVELVQMEVVKFGREESIVI